MAHTTGKYPKDLGAFAPSGEPEDLNRGPGKFETEEAFSAPLNQWGKVSAGKSSSIRSSGPVTITKVGTTNASKTG